MQVTVKGSNQDELLTWTSSNESVAIVNNDGKIWFVGEGRAVITVTSRRGTGRLTVIVEGNVDGMLDLDHWKAYLECTASGDFEPERLVTRGEMAMLLDQLLRDSVRESVDSDEQRYPDVAPDAPYYEMVNRLSELDVLHGYPDGSFRADETLTRATAATMLCQVLQLTGGEDQPEQFTDLPKDNWAYPYIMALHSKGIMYGYDDNTARPDEHITRAQIASMINRVLRPAAISGDDLTVPRDVAPGYWGYDDILYAVNDRVN